MDSTNACTWQERAARLQFRNQAFIGGRFVDALSGRRFDCITPRDGSVLTQVAECDAADVDAAVAAARKAFESGVWRDAHPRQRRTVLLKLARLMEENADELALLETLDMGKPISDSRKIDIPLSIRCVEYYAEAIDKIYDQVGPSGGDAMSLILREPLGVIGVVVPWNFPLMMAVWKLAPALATGNSVVLKPAEQSPLTALFLAELAVQAGLPAGVLNVVPGFGETAGQAIGRHMDVDMLAFTGSTEVGKYFMRYSGESNLKRVSLECGGKSPHIILPDAPDLDRAAREAVGGIFFNQGEVCTAGSRLLVHESIKDEFLERVTHYAARWTPGDPLDPKSTMGAMVDDRQHARVLDYIAKGMAEGASLRLGGGAARTETGGFYIEPTLFDGVTNQMTIAREEIFGPVLSTISFSSVEEAFRIANDTIYGLAAAVWTRDLSTAMKAARAIRAGSVWINCYDGGDITTPFGGFKQSGFGRDRSLHALEKYTDLKSVWIDLS
ncbi:aldehyde dehydrogenase family protein [Niveispirillum sp. SYP-B3756]|uniref:aldehyde dehydrogenase n=1 Tax=Niveispirillum sp. SYP-B3756 TaxID=2662178 RepID=UPI001290C37A|nr:aldehyde dehydrogenase [Niveispirillum sp. SYP-B3756]MQP66509.1 aldehyde dehydrogenase family protein [Niveispirillum sp. SYP-B3756]